MSKVWKPYSCGIIGHGNTVIYTSAIFDIVVGMRKLLIVLRNFERGFKSIPEMPQKSFEFIRQ